MTIKRLLGVLVRVALSVIFAGIFYIGWMAIAIPTFKSEFGGFVVKAVIWILAPILTGVGFAVGPKVFELLPATDKTHFWETYKWCLAGCAIGGGIVWVFGPMLIVFGMFATGTMSVVLHEAVRIRKEVVNNNMASTISELLRITKDILDYSLTEEPADVAGFESFPAQQYIQLYSIKAVYNIILELAFDSLSMIEKKRHVSSGALLRSLFEYYIELLFLAKAPENWKQRELDTKREQQKILNAINNSEDPCFVKLKVDDRFQPRKEELEEALEGHRKNSLYKRCDNVGLVWMYDMVYRSLSPDAHPSIVRYSNRYFKVDPSGKMCEYYSAPQLDEEEAINRLVLLSDILVGSTKCIHQILPNCNNSAIEAQLEKFELEVINAKPRALTE